MVMVMVMVMVRAMARVRVRARAGLGYEPCTRVPSLGLGVGRSNIALYPTSQIQFDVKIVPFRVPVITN